MKGRFEQPRNGRRSDPAPRKPRRDTGYSDPSRNDPYAENGYDRNPYSQDPYGQQEAPQQSYDQYDSQDYSQESYDSGAQNYSQDAYEQPYGDQNYYEEGNGYPSDPQWDDSYQAPQEGRGIGWGILSFFFPLVGLILFLIWKRSKPRAAKASGIGALSGFIVFLVIVLILTIGGSMYYNHMLDKVNIVDMTRPTYPAATEAAAEAVTEAPTTEETTEAPTTEPPVAKREDFVNFLLVGQAGREGEPERFSDTMLVVTLNKFDNSVTVTSLLRDAFVQPPPFRNKYFGQIKLTTVYHMGSYYDNGNPAGSMELMNNTLYENFGLEIDYNLEINFEVFETIINSLGGVDLELTEPEAAYLTKAFDALHWDEDAFNFSAGPAHLDGISALTFARMRKAEGDGESDIKRTARQRKLMEALLKKVKGISISDLQNIANEVLPMVTTNMQKDEITAMLKTVLPMLPGMQFKSGGTCPSNFSGVMVDIYHDGMYHSVLKFVPQNEKKVMRELTLGEVSEP